MMREGVSQIVNITCMPSVTCFNTAILLYRDIIICKWEINGVDHYDTETQATTDCKHIGYSLWTTEYVTSFQKTPSNDQFMLTKYIGSSAGAR